jgi:RNA polymerase sigma-70 factor (sigma-E family)
VESVLTLPSRSDFHELYESEYIGLVHLATVLTGERVIAEELVQEAFLRAHQRWGRVGTYERPGAWVRRVVLNLATSRRRQVAAEVRLLARLGRTSSGEEGEGTDDEFWRLVRRLPRRQAQVVALHYMDDLATSEIAEVLGVAEGTVRATLHQARQQLARRLGQEES